MQDEDVRGLNERAMTREELALQEALRDMGRLNLNEPAGITHAGVVVLGESSRTLSWIWYQTGRAEGDDAVINEGEPIIFVLFHHLLTVITALKIEWCKASARATRWWEEVTLLIEEMRRVQEYGVWKAGWWIGLLGKRSSVDTELNEGVSAYAEEHAARELTRVESLRSSWGNLSSLAKNALIKGTTPVPVDIELEEEADGPELVD